MGKSRNILIFSDGTGQAGGLTPDENISNIYKLYRATRCGPDSEIDPGTQQTSMTLDSMTLAGRRLVLFPARVSMGSYDDGWSRWTLAAARSPVTSDYAGRLKNLCPLAHSPILLSLIHCASSS